MLLHLMCWRVTLKVAYRLAPSVSVFPVSPQRFNCISQCFGMEMHRTLHCILVSFELIFSIPSYLISSSPSSAVHPVVKETGRGEVGVSENKHHSYVWFEQLISQQDLQYSENPALAVNLTIWAEPSRGRQCREVHSELSAHENCGLR